MISLMILTEFMHAAMFKYSSAHDTRTQFAKILTRPGFEDEIDE